jgi:transposase
MPATKWSLISNQDGRGCMFQGARGDTLMLTVFCNPTADRAKELYATSPGV